MRSELLLRVVDKINPDCHYMDAACHKAGDVIVIVPANWQWGKAEISNQEWVILYVDGPQEQLQQLLSPEVDTDPQNPSLVLQRRGFRIDFAKLPKRYRNANRKAGMVKRWGMFSLAEIEAVRYRVQPRSDANILG